MGAVLLITTLAAIWYWWPKTRDAINRRRTWRAIERHKQIGRKKAHTLPYCNKTERSGR